MKVLHVVLGNPYTQQGGLCRYCVDLMEAQRSAGHVVSVLYPREYISGKKPRIIKKKANEYYIFDALPVAITYGVGEPERYIVKAKRNPFEKWLRTNCFDVVHVHSIQGVHKEFFEAAKHLRIPMIYTSHDYYSLCLRGVLVDDEGMLCTEHCYAKCTRCNYGAGLSANKQRVIQSGFYQMMKNWKLIKLLKRTQHAASSSTKSVSKESKIVSSGEIKWYKQLYEYNNEIMNSINLIHCNSDVAAEIYHKYYSFIPQRVVSITRSGLRRSQHIRKSGILSIGYMGGMSEHKGYKLLYNALEILDQNRIEEWKVHLYGGEFSTQIKDDRYHYEGFFTQENEEEVWSTIDVLVVGSQCWETFGFIVLEALCRGIPVLCSDLVGSKDLVKAIDSSFVFNHSDAEALAIRLETLMDMSVYIKTIEKIENVTLPTDIGQHAREIVMLYNEIVSR